MPSKGANPAASVDPMFASYEQLAGSLLKNLSGVCLLGSDLRSRGQSSTLKPEAIAKWLRSLRWDAAHDRTPAGVAQGRGQWLSAIPLEQSDGSLLGAFCVRQSLATLPAQPARHAAGVAQQLKPLLDCVHRELAAAIPARSRVQALTERTAELEWLFKVTGNLKGSLDDGRLVEELLIASTERLDSALGVLSIPEKRLCIEHERDMLDAGPLRTAWQQTQQHLMTWAQRQNRPLVLNGAGRDSNKIARCKILSVPVVRETGRVLGVMAFFKPADAADFASRHVFLARHLGRQTASLVDAQFDLMTGLYTRDGIEQMYGGLSDGPVAADRSIIYVDVDHMHVVNELHGFEVGNELIVRIADLLSPPLLPDGALAARISGDRFAIIMPESDPKAAAKVAEQLQVAANRLVIGPTQNVVDVSISCGVAALVCMPQGLARAMAAAELACKTAKNRGRGRVELYACEDHSMMRRHDDAVAVGELRAALKADRLLLFAQRITPLRNLSLPGGYELLLRLKSEDGSLVAPGPLIVAAQRYQLLPSVDRWVIQRALQMLAPYRGMLKSRGLSMSINVSGQSIGDETFVHHLREQLKAANLPRDCVTIEITEQAAVTNIARANGMIQQLTALGCRFALDDFGTGSNSLTTLKNLQISRVKIDGSFVRDILTDRNSLSTVRAIVELAKGLSMDTVAEYVETEAIAKEVRRLGVDYAQGYAFGKPEPLDSLLESLSKDESRRLHKLFLEM
jgi:diguanylate cyclase (GGDEF)-like protein